MNQEHALTSRRQFLKGAGGVVAASALTGIAIPAAHAAGADTIQVAIVGCGGRGGGAVVNALSTTSGPIKLVAMADAFEDRLKSSYRNLSQSEVSKLVDVPEDRRFVGFDAYKKAMDCLKPGDVVILTTPLAFRWVHFTYAIAKGLNVFMEKPLTADGVTSKKMMKLADDATAKNLKVGVGLMSRHSHAMQQLHDRVSNGDLGDILLMRGYRMFPPASDSALSPKPAGMTDLEFQIRHFHAFVWTGGGLFNDFYIHLIDHCSWMKNEWPVSAQALGGRHYKLDSAGAQCVDQNFDTYSVEYTFKDGTKFFFDGRNMTGAAGFYSSYVHGTKGSAVVSRANDIGTPSAIYKGQSVNAADAVWVSTDTTDPYQNEWDELVLAIRGDKPYNEVKRGVMASMVSSMGRMAAHTGQITKLDDVLNNPIEYAPGLDTLTSATPAPLQPDASGRYPVPQPGMLTNREY